MNIVITGSLGHISKPLTTELVQKGHSVTVISRDAQKKNAIEALGAGAVIGSLDDVTFLTETFKGADAVYCMNPPNFAASDQVAYYQHIGNCFAQAISGAGVKRVVYLSSYGAHLPSGTGFITGSHQTEQLLDAIPGTHVTHIRPGFFYYNLFSFIHMIKTAGFIGNVYGGADRLAMVAPGDIATAVAEEITDLSSLRKVRYVASDDRTCNEIATVLGKAIGMPELKWLVLPAEQVLQSLTMNGVPRNAAENLVEVGQAIHSGILREDYELNKPEFGKVTLEEFASEFAKKFNQ